MPIWLHVLETNIITRSVLDEEAVQQIAAAFPKEYIYFFVEED